MVDVPFDFSDAPKHSHALEVYYWGITCTIFSLISLYLRLTSVVFAKKLGGDWRWKVWEDYCSRQIPHVSTACCDRISSHFIFILWFVYSAFRNFVIYYSRSKFKKLFPKLSLYAASNLMSFFKVISPLLIRWVAELFCFQERVIDSLVTFHNLFISEYVWII